MSANVILDPASLYQTVDNANEALFFEQSIDRAEAARIIGWIGSRLDKPGAYAHGFAPTAQDFESKVYTFTGDRLQNASMRHILNEEAIRVIILLCRELELPKPSFLPDAEKALDDVINGERARHPDKSAAWFCCGRCSIGLWRRCIARPEDSKSYALLHEAWKLLRERRLPKGGWEGLPFQYALSALVENDDPLAMEELEWAQDQLVPLLKRTRSDGRFGPRRKELIRRAMERAN